MESEGRHKTDTAGIDDGRYEFRLCDLHQPALDDGSFDINCKPIWCKWMNDFVRGSSRGRADIK
jgi:hypothetical protein